MKNLKILRHKLACFLFLIFFITYNCNANETKYININMSSEPGTLDWNLATDSSSFLIINNIMAGLTKLNNKLELENNLAEDWYFVEGENQIIFEIKKGVLWSDNVELKSYHFIDSWQRLLNPNTAADYAYFLFDIKNAKEYNSGKIKDFRKVGVRAIDDYTIEINLKTKKSYFPSLMSFMSTFPIRKDLIDIYGESWIKIKNLVTLGPFEMIEKKNNSYMIFKDKSGKKIKIIINENSTSSLAMFENGQLDILDGGGIPLLEIPYLQSKGIINTNNQFRNNYIGFNVNKKPFDDPEIRRAFMLAINKEIFESILQNTVSATNSWIPKGMIGNNKYINLYDPKKAKEIINSKNLKDTKIKFLFPESGNNRLIAEVLQSMWKENLNINVDIQGLEWKVYLSTLDSDRPNMFRAGWAADYPDPHNFMNLFTCKSGNNETGWCDKAYDELIRKSSNEINEKKRVKYYDKAQEILIYKENVIIPLYESNQIFLKSGRLEKFEYSKMGIINFSDLNLKN